MTAFGALSAAMLKGFVRDRITLLFTFLFPLMFIVTFGLLHDGPRHHDGSSSISRMIPMLTWAIAGTGVFGMSMTVVSWRKRHLLRRIRLAPVTVASVLLARLTTNLFVTLAQTASFLAVVLMPTFGVRISARWWLGLPIILMGAIAFSGMGLLVGAVCQSEEAASALANFLVMPMALISGTFFDLDQAPAWLRRIADQTPIHHLNTALMNVLTDTRNLAGLTGSLTALACFTVMTAGAALRSFQWDTDY
ncbi:ABC transporter permease [Streptomyces sp. NPDC098789]|uniref:ABC transporter permease n=1 Tax=Streptomyces sp. NPDC098789 TaxID=3366098 RepID=UPI0038040059